MHTKPLLTNYKLVYDQTLCNIMSQTDRYVLAANQTQARLREAYKDSSIIYRIYDLQKIKATYQVMQDGGDMALVLRPTPSMGDCLTSSLEAYVSSPENRYVKAMFLQPNGQSIVNFHVVVVDIITDGSEYINTYQNGLHKKLSDALWKANNVILKSIDLHKSDNISIKYFKDKISHEFGASNRKRVIQQLMSPLTMPDLKVYHGQHTTYNTTAWMPTTIEDAT
jgi:hypothetical protein